MANENLSGLIAAQVLLQYDFEVDLYNDSSSSVHSLLLLSLISMQKVCLHVVMCHVVLSKAKKKSRRYRFKNITFEPFHVNSIH